MNLTWRILIQFNRLLLLYSPAIFCGAIVFIYFPAIPPSLQGLFIWLPLIFVLLAGSIHAYVSDLEQRVAKLEHERKL